MDEYPKYQRVRRTPEKKKINPWMIIGWIFLILIGFIIFLNLIIGCGLAIAISNSGAI